MALSPSQLWFRKFSYGLPWNIGLITVGAVLVAVSLKSVIIPHGFLAGGLSGLGVLAYYVFGGLTPGMWFLALNVPIFLMGWVFVSRRFFLYSVYGTLAVTLFMELITYQMAITDKWLAVLAGGVLMGAGVGVALRSLGSTGGVDILMVIFFQKYNLRMGQFEFLFNLLVFAGGLIWLNLESVLYSLALIAVMSVVIEHCLGLFNERKMALVISEKPDELAQEIIERLGRGVTFIDATGGYTGQPRRVILTVVHNHQLKRLEELVYELDPAAFTIIGTTFNVLGEGFATRKVY